MNKLRNITAETYNRSAAELAEHFERIDPRTEDINLVFDLLGNPENPRIVEIGCGDGRDAQEIASRTNDYLGFDISNSFIEMAQQKVPEARFVVADAANFEFPPNVDAIFAFASLLHLSREEVQDIFSRAHNALSPGGIFYSSLKYSPNYFGEIKKDRFGERLFYFYNDELIKDLAGDGYQVAKSWHKTLSDTEWLEIALRKV